METKRAFTAIMLSMIILLGYQYFFVPAPTQIPPENTEIQTTQPAATPTALPQAGEPAATPVLAASPAEDPEQTSPAAAAAKDISVETGLYRAIITENGAGIKSFQLKEYKESIKPNAPAKELIFTENAANLPLQFSWGNGIPSRAALYSSNHTNLHTEPGGEATLAMTADLGSGITVERTMTFRDDSYLAALAITVRNSSGTALQGAPYLRTTNRPFSQESSSNNYQFHGPALYLDNALQEIKVKDLKDKGPQSLSGNLTWAAYEDTYFLCGILPEQTTQNSVSMAASGEDTVTITVNGQQDILQPGGEKTYHYSIFLGPKKLATLKEAGSNLEKIINFGWFDMVAKPALFLLNFFYRYIHNYGIAIILVTVLFKLLFWPISHKGMKSMKTMQKIQPKMAKLREKFKDDKERLNQEMITLYRTYKINPLGGCLPMVLQIPVFFALYKVLLQTIELRHAPFMLWITDLAAPDRLPIGIDIPFLGGIPVLTLLMGASMFLQQKMTPTPADPTQARVMLFLPVVFTFMFLNFASGLVLYWFINNLLSIGQQYFINRSVEA